MSDSVRPHRRQPTRLRCPWGSPGKNTGVGCQFLLQCMKVKVKSLSRVRLLATPWTTAYQAPPSMGFSRQEYWVGCHCLLRAEGWMLRKPFIASSFWFVISITLGFPGGAVVKNLLAMRETWVRSLGQEDPSEKEMATHSGILAWKIPWTEEPGGLQSMGSQRVGHDLATSLHFRG